MQGEAEKERVSTNGAVDALLYLAHRQGREIRRSCLAPALNPHDLKSAAGKEWLAGWRYEDSLFAARANAQRKLTLPCYYVRGAECSPQCGGRGLCLDVA